MAQAQHAGSGGSSTKPKTTKKETPITTSPTATRSSSSAAPTPAPAAAPAASTIKVPKPTFGQRIGNAINNFANKLVQSNPNIGQSSGVNNSSTWAGLVSTPATSSKPTTSVGQAFKPATTQTTKPVTATNPNQIQIAKPPKAGASNESSYTFLTPGGSGASAVSKQDYTAKFNENADDYIGTMKRIFNGVGDQNGIDDPDFLRTQLSNGKALIAELEKNPNGFDKDYIERSIASIQNSNNLIRERLMILQLASSPNPEVSSKAQEIIEKYANYDPMSNIDETTGKLKSKYEPANADWVLKTVAGTAPQGNRGTSSVISSVLESSTMSPKDKYNAILKSYQTDWASFEKVPKETGLDSYLIWQDETYKLLGEDYAASAEYIQNFADQLIEEYGVDSDSEEIQQLRGIVKSYEAMAKGATLDDFFNGFADEHEFNQWYLAEAAKGNNRDDFVGFDVDKVRDSITDIENRIAIKQQELNEVRSSSKGFGKSGMESVPKIQELENELLTLKDRRDDYNKIVSAYETAKELDTAIDSSFQYQEDVDAKTDELIKLEDKAAESKAAFDKARMITREGLTAQEFLELEQKAADDAAAVDTARKELSHMHEMQALATSGLSRDAAVLSTLSAPTDNRTFGQQVAGWTKATKADLKAALTDGTLSWKDLGAAAKNAAVNAYNIADLRLVQTMDFLVGEDSPLTGHGTAIGELRLLGSVALEGLGINTRFADDDRIGYFAEQAQKDQAAIEQNRKNIENAVSNNKTVADIANLLSDTFSCAFDLIPMTVMAVATGGASAAPTLAAGTTEYLTYVSSINTGSELSRMATIMTQDLAATAKNPMYWTSFASVAGPSYQDALDQGLSKDVATTYALINSAINAKIEIGGGLETFPERIRDGVYKTDKGFWAASLDAVKELFTESGFDEAKEELWQGAAERALMAAAKGDNLTWTDTGEEHTTALFSTTAQDAIINPKLMAKEAGAGYLGGVLLGGGQQILNSSVQAVSEAKLNNRFAQEYNTIEKQQQFIADSKYLGNTSENVMAADAQLNPKEESTAAKQLSGKELLAIARENEKASGEAKVGLAAKRIGLSTEDIEAIKRDFANSDARETNKFIKGMADMYRWATLDGEIESASRYLPDTDYLSNEAKSHIYNMGQKVGNPDLDLTKTETFTVGNITGTITGLKTVGNELRVQLTDAEGNVREVAVSGETMPQLPKAIQDLWKEFGDKAGMLYEAYDPSISFRQYRNDVRALMSAASNSTQSWTEFSQTEGAAKLAPSLSPELKQQLWDSVQKTNRHTAVVKSQITRANKAADRTVNEVTPGEVKGKKFSVTLKNANGKNVNVDLAKYKVTKAEKGSKEARALKVAEAAAKVFGINIYLYDAPNTGIAGAFVGEDTIYLNMQDVDAKGDYIIMKSLSHELTHFIQKNSARDYQALKSFMVDKLLQKQKGMTYEQLLQDKITRENLTGPDVIARAEDEIVADGCEMMLKNSKVFEELATQNLSLGKRIMKWLNNVKRAIRDLYGEQSATFEEAEYMKQFIDEQQKLWDRGLKNAVLNRDAQRKAEAKKNNASAFQAAPTSAHAGAHVPTGVSPDSMKNAAVNAESSNEIFDADTTVVLDGEPTFSFVALGEASGFNAFRNADGERFFMRDGKVVTEVTTKDIEKSAIGALVRASNLSVEDAQKEIKFFARICNMAIQYRDFGMTMKFVGSTVFTAMKQNSDTQYGTTYDFPSICTKTQAIINAMSAAMVARKRGLSKMEVLDLYRDAFEMKNAVPCPECYVFTHWIGIGGLLDNIYKYQTKYCAPERTAQDVWAEYKTIADKILREGEGKTFSKRKADLKDKAQKHVDQLIKWRDEGSPPRGHKKSEAFTAKQQSELQKWQNEVDQYNAMTWLTDVYFAGSPLSGWVFDKKMTAATLQKNLDSIDPTTLSMNPRAAVDPDILFDLNRGDDFALDYPEAWDFRTTQGNGYGKAITPYADTVLGEGIMITNNDDFIAQKKEFARVNPRGSRMRNPFLDLGIDGQLTEKAQNILDGARRKMKAQNFLGGQRFSSTSDARPDTLSDFLLAVLEVQAMGGKVQVYTKVTGAVDAYCGWGFSVNMSMMPRFGGLDANGFLQDTAVGGVNPFTAQMMRTKEGNDSAGTITIGVNDNHIRALMNDQQGRIFDKLTGKWRTYTLGRDFIIPYHASGGDATIVDMMRKIQEGEETADSGRKIQSSDYTKTQEDKILSDEMLKAVGEELWGRKLTDEDIELIHARRAARKAIMSGRGNVDMDVVNGSRFLTALYNKFKVKGGEWYEVTVAGSKFESKIFPNEFWDKTVTYNNSSKITQDYLDYCEELGFLHRFSGRIVDEKAKALVRISGYDQFGNQTKLTDLAHKVDENGNETNEIEPFFWKTLTDRRMYDNEGNYLEQKYVTLTHSEVVEPTEAKPGGSFAYAFDGSREFNQELSNQQVEKIKAEAAAESNTENNVRFSFVRPSDDLIHKAELSEALGTDAITIWNEYGLLKGPDGKWRTELDDSRIRFYKNGNAKSSGHGHMLDDYLEFPELYEQYPALKNIGVTENPEAPNIRTSFDPATGTININPNAHMSKDVKRLAVLHEVQHMIQRLEGWAAEEYGYGEQEAKLVEARHNLSKAQRRAMLPKLLSTIDKTYMPMAKSGQEKAVQQLVDDAAHAAGYTEKAYHGSVHFGDHTVLETSGIDSTSDGGTYEWSPYFATDDLAIAKTYSGKDEARQIGRTSHKGKKITEAELEHRAELLISDLFATLNDRFNTVLIYSDIEKIEDYCNAIEYDLEDYIEGYLDEPTFQHHLSNLSNKIVEVLKNNKDVVEEEDFTWFYSEAWINAHIAINDLIKDADSIRDRYGNYQYWINTENFLVVEADFHKWYDLTYPGTGETGLKTRDIAKLARDDGYSGVKILNVYDIGPKSWSGPAGTVYIFFDPQTQVKSADPVTYDDEGKIIPLSERFNPKNKDIRYSLIRQFPNERSFLDAYNNRLDEEFEGYVLSPAQERMVIPKIENDAQADYYNNLPKYAEDIATGMLPFVPGDAIPDYDRSLIKYSSEWYKKNGLPIPAKRTPYVLFEPTLVDDGSVVERDELPFSIVPQRERTAAEQLIMDRNALAAQEEYFKNDARVPDINRKVRPTLRNETAKESATTETPSESGGESTNAGTSAGVSTGTGTGANVGTSTPEGARVGESSQSGSTEQSRVATNTYFNSDIYDDVGGMENTFDRNGNFLYNQANNEQSLEEAKRRLTEDPEGWKQKLSEAVPAGAVNAAWSDQDLDTAMGILAQEIKNANAIDDPNISPEERYAKVDEWLQRIQSRGTQAGQFIQAFAKYNKTAEGVLVIAMRNLQQNPRLTEEQRKAIIHQMLEFSQTLAAIKDKGDSAKNREALIEIIKKQGQVRKTPVHNNVIKALQKEQFQYLYDAALNQLYNIAADYRTASVGQILSTYQTIAHLFNLRTGLRNVGANLAFRTVANQLVNTIATPMDWLLGGITGNRTVNFTPLGRLDKDVRASEHERGRRAMIEAELDIDPYGGRDKYGTSRRTFKMKNGPVSKVMSTLEKYMAYELNVTDEISKGIILGEVMKSLRPFIENKQLSEEEAVALGKRAMLYQTFQDDNLVSDVLSGLKSAFNIIGIGTKNGKTLGPIPIRDFGAGDLVNKYTQVPGSLLMRMIEFSPIGAAKAVIDLALMFNAYHQLNQATTIDDAENRIKEAKLALDSARREGGDVTAAKEALKQATENLNEIKSKMRNGGDIRARAFIKEEGTRTRKRISIDKQTARMNALHRQREFVMQVARCLSGQILISLFAALAKTGLLRKDDADEDKDILAMLTSSGVTGIQLNLSGLSRWLDGDENFGEWQTSDILMDEDFLEPLNNLMVIGTLIAEDPEADMFSRNMMNNTLAALVDSFSDLSVMQTLSTIRSSISNAQYDLESSEDATGNIAKIGLNVAFDVARSSVSGFIPGPVRQLATAQDMYARDMYASTTMEGKLADSIRSALPGQRQKLPVKLDSYGNPRITEEDAGLRFLNAFINPGSIRTYKNSELTNEIDRLYQATGASGLLPKRYAPYSIKDQMSKDPAYELTAEEKLRYQTTRGREAEKYQNQLIRSEEYQNASDEMKADLMRKVVDYADYIAKKEFLDNKGYTRDDGRGYTSKYHEQLRVALEAGLDIGEAAKFFSQAETGANSYWIDDSRQSTLNEMYQSGQIDEQGYLDMYRASLGVELDEEATAAYDKFENAVNVYGMAPDKYWDERDRIAKLKGTMESTGLSKSKLTAYNKRVLGEAIWEAAATENEARALWLGVSSYTKPDEVLKYKPRNWQPNTTWQPNNP